MEVKARLRIDRCDRKLKRCGRNKVDRAERGWTHSVLMGEVRDERKMWLRKVIGPWEREE